MSILTWVAGGRQRSRKQLCVNDPVSKLAFSGTGQGLCQALAPTLLFRKDSRSLEARPTAGGAEGGVLGNRTEEGA